MNTRTTLLLLILFTAGWMACNGQKKVAGESQRFGSTSDSLFFSIERTPCFGKCAAYTLNVYRDGKAEYIGRSNAPRQGKYTGTVDRATMEAILAKAEAIGYFGLEDTYDSQVTDLPSTITRIVSGDRDKRIVARHRTPLTLKVFAQEADELLKDVVWTPVEGQK